jgi:hypothetical protein
MAVRAKRAICTACWSFALGTPQTAVVTCEEVVSTNAEGNESLSQTERRTNIAIPNCLYFKNAALFGNGIKGLKDTLEQSEDLVRIPHRAPSRESSNVRDWREAEQQVRR